MKLLYKAGKYRDESFPDYIFRLASWNGFNDGESFVRFLRLKYMNLEKKFSFDGEVHHDKHLKKWFECKTTLEFYFNKSFDDYELNLESIFLPGKKRSLHSICPDCWSQNAYVRFFWRFNFYKKCHVHGVSMLFVRLIPHGRALDRESIVLPQHKDLWLSSCNVTEIFLKKIGEKSFNCFDVENERKISEDEDKLWKSVLVFLRERFKLDLHINHVYELIPREDLVGTPIAQRLKKIKELLILKFQGFEKLICASVVAKIIQMRLFRFDSFRLRCSRDLENWILSEAYSVSHLFYIYLVGIQDHIFSSEQDNYERRVRPVDLEKVSDRGLCQFILESSILTPQEISRIYSGGKFYSNGAIKCEGYVGRRHYNYEEYIQAANVDIFEMEPEPR